jgi:hypothetical protein
VTPTRHSRTARPRSRAPSASTTPGVAHGTRPIRKLFSKQEFGQTTDRRCTILTGLIRDLGGDPDHVSPPPGWPRPTVRPRSSRPWCRVRLGAPRTGRPRRSVPEICQKLRHTRPHHLPRRRVQQRGSTSAIVWGHEVAQGVVNHRRGHGMQEVRGSNPLSSTPAQRPNPAPTVPQSPASGSKSAAIGAAKGDPAPARLSFARACRATAGPGPVTDDGIGQAVRH